jgi:hypothetical protein
MKPTLPISEDAVVLESGTRARGAYGDLLAAAFGMRDPRALITRVLNESTLAVTEIECQQNFGRTAPIPREDAYLVALQLRACLSADPAPATGSDKARADRQIRGGCRRRTCCHHAPPR